MGVYWGGHLRNDFKTFKKNDQLLNDLIKSENVPCLPYETFNLENT